MKVQNLPHSSLPKTLSTPPGDGQQPQGPKDRYAAYNEADADKNRVGYETAYNLSRGLAYAFEGGARIGQTMQLGSSIFGASAGSLAGSIGLVGGTIDVARGASLAQQSAINRNRTGTVLGGLQVAQGVATWISAGAALAGGPALVSQVAAVAAVGALAGRLGMQAHAKHQASKEVKKTPPTPIQPVSIPFDEKAKPKGDGRLLENTFAIAKSISDAAGNLGGMGAGWNNVGGLFSGNAPTGIWKGLGIVGSTYTVLQSSSMVAHAAGNQHLDDTLVGTIGIVQGAASMAVSLGVGGRLLPGIAVGAYILKSAVPLLQLKKKLTGDNDGNENGMWNRLKENIGHVFSGAPAEAPEAPPSADDKRELKAPEKSAAAPKDENKDELPPQN
ncbi:hypothetical protein IV102_24120 [bacterium]|nr:hypothetical protein [bacterium]